jgi:hypothetical protein
MSGARVETVGTLGVSAALLVRPRMLRSTELNRLCGRLLGLLALVGPEVPAVRRER